MANKRGRQDAPLSERELRLKLFEKLLRNNGLDEPAPPAPEAPAPRRNTLSDEQRRAMRKVIFRKPV